MDARQMKASALMKRNITLLLKRHQQRQIRLAEYCGKDRSWISKVLWSDSRGIPLKHLDKVARFFGIQTYQLFTPDAAELQLGEPLTEPERELIVKYRAMEKEHRRTLELDADMLLLFQKDEIKAKKLFRVRSVKHRSHSARK
jgi:hypothetical protein